MYRYKAPNDGCTRFSVNGLKHIDKIGKLISIEGYTVGNHVLFKSLNHPWTDNKVRIIVKGEKGTCTFGGFLWGYGGEGPHGLRDLFIKCGMEKEIAEYYAFTGTLGTNQADDKNTKLYNKTTLWKFLNSDVGWNRVNTDTPIGFVKGQKLMCSYVWGQPDKCTFVRYMKNTDMAIIKTTKYFGCDTWEVPVKSLTTV